MKNSTLTVIFLVLYAVGFQVSQSLASLAGTFFVLQFLVLAVDSCLTRRWSLMAWSARVAAIAATLYCGVLLVGLYYNTATLNFSDALSSAPLWLVPFASLYISRSETGRFNAVLIKVVFLGTMANLLHSLVQVAFLGHPNATSWMKNPIYLAYATLPVLVFWTERLSRKRFTFSGSLLGDYEFMGTLAATLTLLLTASRMATVVGIVYLACRGLPWIYRWGRFRGLVAALVIAAGIGAALYRYHPVVAPKIRQARLMKRNPSLRARLAIWEHNRALFMANPVFGVGYKQNGVSGDQDASWNRHKIVGPQLHYAHSIYWQSLAESGIVGAALLLTSLLALALYCPPLWPLFLITAVAGITENTFSNSKPLHAFLGIVLLTVLTSRRNESQIQL